MIKITSKSMRASTILKTAEVDDGGRIDRGWKDTSTGQVRWGWALTSAAGESRWLGRTAAEALDNLRTGAIVGQRIE